MTRYSPGRVHSWALAGLASVAFTSLARAQITPAVPAIAGETPEHFDGESVTFDQAVERALAQNPTALIAQQELYRARALREQIAATSLPTVTANGTYQRLNANRETSATVDGVTNVDIVQPQNSVGANLLINVPVTPKGWGQWSHASDNVHVAALSVEDVQRQVGLETGRAYLTVLTQRRLVELSRSARDTARAQRDFAQQRLQGGVGNRIDAVRAQQELATSESQLATAKVQLERAREALGVLLGAENAVDATVEPDLVFKDPIETALDEVKTRADVKEAQLRKDAAHHVLRDSWLDYMPYMNMQFEPFYQNPPTLTLPKTGWQAQLLLTAPIYDGGLRYGQRRERSALDSEAQLQLENTVRQAKSEVRVAFDSVREADRALFAAREAAKQAREALKLNNLAYHEGTATNLELIDAERQARDTDTQSALAEDTAREARLDLLEASGRFPARR